MEITDELLYAHAGRARDLWLSTLPKDEDLPPFVPSARFERKMKRLLAQQCRSPQANRTLLYAKRTAVAAMVVLAVSFGGLMTVQAHREKVVEFVTHVFHELTDYRFVKDAPDTGAVELPDLTFGYVPEGFELTEDRLVNGGRRRHFEYKNSSGEFFRLSQQGITADGDYHTILDTEDAQTYPVTVNGNEGVFNTKSGYSTIIWSNGSVVYYLSGTISPDELILIAENLQLF